MQQYVTVVHVRTLKDIEASSAEWAFTYIRGQCIYRQMRELTLRIKERGSVNVMTDNAYYEEGQ
jgi:hypothetical protein